MFTEICKALDFPPESYNTLTEAYLSLTDNQEANTLFQRAVDTLLTPNEVVFNEMSAKLTELKAIHPYTLNMVLCISVLEPLGKLYEDAGLTEELETHKKALKQKLQSCKENFGMWGLEDCFWQWMFHELNCVSLGRLEFEPFHHCSDVEYKGIKKGDPVILIHIPRAKSLDIDEVMDSLALGYERFKDRFDNGVVPFMTHSWLLYPPFLSEVFKKGGNIQKFAELFDIIAENTAGYQNFPNVFGCPYPGEDLSGVPQETSLQRSMLEFIKRGNLMGEGCGIFLYGENGILKS